MQSRLQVNGMNDDTPRWLRGNLHTHTLNSDGDSSPRDVARWYRDSGYQFLAITDHNLRTGVEDLQRELDREREASATPEFTLLGGEEVTDDLTRDGRRYDLHTNAIGCSTTLGPQGGASKAELLQRTIDAIRAAGGLPIVNHPNFRWSVDTTDLLSLSSPFFLEFYNGHPEANNLGSQEVPASEHLWDILLTAGRNVLGVAGDDAHVFRRFHARLPNPGRAWVSCRATRRARTILRAMSDGDFYCSTGVELTEVTASRDALSVRVQPQFDCAHLIRFIGSGGRVLSEVEANQGTHRLEGGYVRAKIVSSQGHCAWTQPVFASSFS
jgi:hypothetical protein